MHLLNPLEKSVMEQKEGGKIKLTGEPTGSPIESEEARNDYENEGFE
jgi:hypothetical protein